MNPTQNGFDGTQGMPQPQADLPAPAIPQMDATMPMTATPQAGQIQPAFQNVSQPDTDSSATESQSAFVSTGGSSDAPSVADDVDLIEKEWVLKAKDIVARTRDDPNLQSKEMSKFKASYLKTRFSKDLKVSEN